MYEIIKDKESGLYRIISEIEPLDKENEEVVLLNSMPKASVVSLISDEFRTMIDSGLCDENYRDFKDKISFIKTITLDL